MKLAVVIAAFDERPNIVALVERLDRALADRRGSRQLLFVVEGTDGTREEIERLAESIPDLEVRFRARPRGLGEAFRLGFEAVAPDADVVVTLDADLNHAPEEIPRLVAALETHHADIVVGSRELPGSVIEGIPAWKRALSRLVNSALERLRGVAVRDKTSGFRAYRAEALRRLEIRTPGFSFLADLLLQARHLGLRIHEEPIHFVYRRAGVSKLPFLRTSFEYLRLLAASMPRDSLALGAWLLIGVALRVLAAFPIHHFAADGDASLTAMGALRILDGEPVVFFSGTRIGALGCYLAAGLFGLLGPTRTALALVPLLLGLATLIVGLGALRELGGLPAAAAGAPLLAAAPPAVTFWTSMPVGYGEILLLGALSLLLAARAVRRGWTPVRATLFGVVAGLGLWTSVLTFCAILPALLWGVARAGAGRSRGKLLAAGVAGLVVGAVPWWTYHLGSGLDALRAASGTRAVGGLGAVLDNLAFTLGHRLPELLAWTAPLRPYLPSEAARAAAGASVLLLYGCLAALAAVAVVRASGRQERRSRRDLMALALGVAIATLLANVLSEAGSRRGQTVRYLLPLFLSLPLLAAAAASGHRRRVATFAVALLALFDVAAFHGPWHPARRSWDREAAEDAALVERLRAQGVDAISGSFSQVFAFNFLSRRELIGAPIEKAWNTRVVDRDLPSAPLRWVLLGRGRRERGEILRCAPRALPGGRLEPVGAARWLWAGGRSTLPGAPAAVQLEAIRSACSELGEVERWRLAAGG